ncbi:formamidopyrimidine-DNA glycosylase [Brachybacterium sp. EF45031]|uniref:DNA-formamidopyrimidine glycosylase family protein n=1 Tax=Brachybacterium sillae TaxID=2810536 RepID=UPI00217E5F4E|nr:DNA-formamidopyrimidine glycosylase family protein [Brachybacterium sillae]MCS6710951.1 formamidopyrimidine-DNA glycosylase [Brachybacterium sillae]
MPEGDTVYRQCAVLHDALAGSQLDRAELRVPRHATENLSGWRVEEVVPRGKHLLIRLSSPMAASEHTPRLLTLHSHLMMDGTWWVERGGRLVRPRDEGREDARAKAPHTIRILLEATRPDGETVRALGLDVQQVRLVPTAEEASLIGHLGPDLLDPDWGPELAAQAARALQQAGTRAVGFALLDQRILAGIGNVYRSEICFLEGIHPLAPVNALPDPAHTVDLAHRLLRANRDRYRRITTGGAMGRDGDLWVYARVGRPCRRCGSRIVREYIIDPAAPDQGERSVYTCPRCQPRPPGAPPVVRRWDRAD